MSATRRRIRLLSRRGFLWRAQPRAPHRMPVRTPVELRSLGTIRTRVERLASACLPSPAPPVIIHEQFR